jgi:CRISPR/Cas system-associated exonuclease Cas4 (RecB family)
MIVEKILEAKRRSIKQYPIHSNRASELGHPCERYHVLNRTRWHEKALHDERLQLIFDLGKDIEQITVRDLQDAGFEVVEQQRPFQWKEYQITGTVDGKILIDGEAVPFEVKSCSPFVYDKINSIDDLKNGKYHYLRKYPGQLVLYMLMDNKDKAVFIFKNKQTGAYKEIWMELDYALGEELITRAESINRHIAAGTLPEPINDDMWCDDCGYAHICLPERVGKEPEIDDSDLADLLLEMDALSAQVARHKEISDEVRERVKGREKIVCGPFVIVGKWIDRAESVVKASRYWRYKLIRG